MQGHSLRSLPKPRRLARIALRREPWIKREIRRASDVYGTGYGAWRVCPDGLTAESVVYSFGVGDDISFDLELIERFGLEVFAFDPTPKSIEWVGQQQLPAAFRFWPYGIAGHDGVAVFYPPQNDGYVSYTMAGGQGLLVRPIEAPVYRLDTIARLHGHERIDLLKLDVEGAEYDVIDGIPSSGVDVRQLLVEFHHRFEGIGAARTKRAVQTLNSAGFRIFAVSGSGDEYSFLRVT